MRNALVRFGALLSLAALAACGSTSADPSANPPATDDTGGSTEADGGGSKPNANVKQTVAIESGEIIGEEEDGGLIAFRGIPYAAPPIGDLRWKPPAPVAAWSVPRDTKAYASPCLQQSGSGSEDCLYLNVWAHKGSHAPRPVLLFIHGGGFIEGASSEAFYAGEQLAIDTGAVVVSINYRLGALGFLALPQLQNEVANNATGTYGLLDQIAALDWVQKNIGVLGGDSTKVLIFGESAGGSSVLALLASPLAKGKFAAAVQQSGPPLIFPFLNEKSPEGDDSAFNAGILFAASAGCGGVADPIACIRALPAAKVHDAQVAVSQQTTHLLPLSRFIPSVDGVVLPKRPLEALADGTANDVPTIFGANEDEGVSFLQTLPPKDDETFVRALYEAKFTKAVGDQIYDLYAAEGSSHARLVEFVGDFIFNCPIESLARAGAGGQPTYLYTFGRGYSSGAYANRGALHGVELFYLFSSFDALLYTPKEDDLAFAKSMKSAWLSLVEKGAPTFEPAWPAYTTATHTQMELNIPSTASPVYRKGRCDVLRSLNLLK